MISYRFGPFRLVPSQRLLERNGDAIPLTAKAMDLLVALVLHRSRALTKDEILATVWPGVAVEEGNLAQQVHLLRRALADAGEAVATVPRHGYRFVAPVIEESESPEIRIGAHCLIWDERTYPLGEGVTSIGRAEDADIQILLPSVSRQHARVVVRGAEATLEDLDSRHGTWRGSIRVRASLPLVSGDEIRLGSAILVYRFVRSTDTTM